MFAGSLTLFNIPDRSIGISLGTIFAVVGVTAALSVFVLSKGLLIQRKKPVTGAKAMIGSVGVVRRDLTPEGKVAVRGEYWDARSVDGTLRAGDRVRVQGVEGRLLLVRRLVD